VELEGLEGQEQWQPLLVLQEQPVALVLLVQHLPLAR
jgi:hypothetical protein